MVKSLAFEGELCIFATLRGRRFQSHLSLGGAAAAAHLPRGRRRRRAGGYAAEPRVAWDGGSGDLIGRNHFLWDS